MKTFIANLLKSIRINPEFYENGIKRRGIDFDFKRLLDLDRERLELLKEIESLKHRQNDLSAQKDFKQAKLLKDKIKNLTPVLSQKEELLEQLAHLVPNPPFEGAPEGGEENNKIIREWGKKPDFDFKPKDYLTIAVNLGLIDVERAAKVSGSRFGYLKGDLALMEFALVRLAMNELFKEGFMPIIPPVMIKEESMRGMGYLERGKDEIYYLPQDELYLVGTSEQSIGPMHSNEKFEDSDLPKRYVAFSTCFRREAGSYGKDTKGILRVHQFDKVEMFSLTAPDKSNDEHQLILSLEERLMQLLEIPYRIVQLATGDLAYPSAGTFDIEAWMPGQNEYRETHSTSNTTDFQTRRLNIRYKPGGYVHALNGTAFAIGRMLIAIIENYQNKDGSIETPKALRSYMI